MRAHLPATLLPRPPQPHRGSLREDKAHPLRKMCARAKEALIEAMGRALGGVDTEDVRDSSLTVATASRRSNYERRCDELSRRSPPNTDAVNKSVEPPKRKRRGNYSNTQAGRGAGGCSDEASSGIGCETTLRFARRGAKVVASARSEEGLDSLVEEIRGGGGGGGGPPPPPPPRWFSNKGPPPPPPQAAFPPRGGFPPRK